MSIKTRSLISSIACVIVLTITTSTLAEELTVWSQVAHSRFAQLDVSGGGSAYGTDVHDGSSEVLVPQFDPALGTLNSVKITYHGSTESYAYYAWSYSLAGITGVIDYDIDSTTAGISFHKGGTDSIDGIYGGASNPGNNEEWVEMELNKTVTHTGGAALAAATGTDNLTFDSSFSVSINGATYGYPASLYATHQAVWVGSVTVTYDYTP